mgnify:FL=1
MAIKSLFSSFLNKNKSTKDNIQWPEECLSEQQQQQKSSDFHALYEKTQDQQAIFNLCKQAADEGVIDALYLLGLMYENGDGQKQYPQQAAECYWRAAEQGKAEAQYNLALLYTQGTLGQQDYLTAFHWFEKAADNGIVQAQYNLANCYDQALGCIEDKTKAFNGFIKAAEQGFVPAWQNIAVMHYQGEGTEKDLIKAYAWTLLAAKAGQEEAKASEPTLTQELSSEQIISGKVLLDELLERYSSFIPQAHLSDTDTNAVINQFYNAIESHSNDD